MIRLILIAIIAIFIILFLLEHSKLTGQIECSPQFSEEQQQRFNGKSFSFGIDQTPYRYKFSSLFNHNINNLDQAYESITWSYKDCQSFWQKEGIYLEAAYEDTKSIIVNTVGLGFMFDYHLKYNHW